MKSRTNFLPTLTLPGTHEREAVCQARLKAGQPLKHPDDAQDPLDSGLLMGTRRNGFNVPVGTLDERTKELRTNRQASDFTESSRFTQQVFGECIPAAIQPKNFSTILRIHRRKAGLSMRGLSSLSGVALSTIYYYEHDLRPARLDVLIALARALKTTLLFGHEACA